MPEQAQLMSATAVRERLGSYPAWQLGDDGQLHAEFVFKNFSRAVLFLNAIAHLAESLDHHPDLYLHDYKRLTVRVMTHSVGGITERDFALIAQIEALPRPE